MIDRIEGKIAELEPTHVVVMTGGVGLYLSISLRTYEAINKSSNTSLFTYLNVREDALQLYGFADKKERAAFKLLIGISGVGPRVAQALLSSLSVAAMAEAVEAGDWKRLTTAPGVGRKLAERMLIELRGKLGNGEKTSPSNVAESSYHGNSTQVSDVVEALMSLGHHQVQAEKLAGRAVNALGEDASVQELIRAALRS